MLFEQNISTFEWKSISKYFVNVLRKCFSISKPKTTVTLFLDFNKRGMIYILFLFY